MKQEVETFISDYQTWVNQEKYKEFKLPQITPAWQKRLLENKKFNNPYAILFGPFYLMLLGGAWSGLLSLLLEIFLACLTFVFTSNIAAAIAIYFVLSFLFSYFSNALYIESKTAFKKKMQDFEPKATTHYFNISSKRLIIASVLTGGFYLVYWFYKNAKAVKDDQKDNRVSPLATGWFFVFLSGDVFKNIKRSLSAFNYPKALNADLSAMLILLLSIIMGIASNVKEASFVLFSALYGAVWLVIIFTALVVNSWQKAIRFYSEKNTIPIVKGSSVGEVLCIIAGILLNAMFLLGTAQILYIWFVVLTQ